MSKASPAIIELNDTGIVCHHGEQQILSPGYALLTKQGVTTGSAARARAWLEPQHSFNQYWHQLSMAPLSAHNTHARHYADLAYAQLQQLHFEAGAPKEIIFSIPGSFNHEQLAILLGLAKACGLEVTGLVDSAVCALASKHLEITNNLDIKNAVHLDIHLHNAVLTTLTCDSSDNLTVQHSVPHIRRAEVFTLTGLGLKSLEDAWVQTIAKRFIGEYRYDPLHTATGEQALRDQLSDWLLALETASEITISLATPNGQLQLGMTRTNFIEAIQEKLEALSRAAIRTVTEHADNTSLLLSHRVAALPGIDALLPGAFSLAADSVIAGCRAHQATITNFQEQVLVTALPFGKTSNKSDKPLSKNILSNKMEATHLLYQHQAYRINHGLILRPHKDGLIIQPLDPQDSHPKNSHPKNNNPDEIYLLKDDESLRLSTRQTVDCCGDSNALKAGDTLTVNNGDEQNPTHDSRLELIQVL
ncbi:MAG: hypothetical protein KBT63_11710 [Porticoccaceae bacterium]|nr:hypothetical protein [Porticoccaceae bacterium]